MKRIGSSRFGILLVLLALTASLEPIVCPLLGLIHEHRAHGDAAFAGLDHCHGEHEHEVDSRHHETQRHGDCDHCHEHQHRVIERPGTLVGRTLALPVTVSPSNAIVAALRPCDASAHANERATLPSGRPSGLPPLPLRI